MPELSLPSRAVKRAAVLGAGVMGAQIAAHLANAGIQVLLLDLPAENHPNARALGALKALKKARPEPFFVPEYVNRITPGNFRDDMPKLATVDWVIEAVVERLDVKQQLLESAAAHLSEQAVIATNTSGLSVTAIADSLPEAIRPRVLGMHFFNPPRYQKLLEIIPHEGTAEAVVDWAKHVSEAVLGKGTVIARDTPNFIGNRIGVFSIALALREWANGNLSLTEIETLTGPAAGRPKSATFRTADLVGIDVLAHVAGHLASATDDEAADVFTLPDIVTKLIGQKCLGAKTKAGFYRKDKTGILAINPETLEYEATTPPTWPVLGKLKRTPEAADRIRLLYADETAAGDGFRRLVIPLLLYAARRVGEITDDPTSIDRAMRWGFAWDLGPFEIWDAIGFDEVCRAIKSTGESLPQWIADLREQDIHAFYGLAGHLRRQSPDPKLSLRNLALIDETPACAFLDLGEGVLLCEFRTKAKTISSSVLQGINQAIEMVENDSYWKGLVIGNEGPRFSAGADLSEMAGAVMARDFAPVDQMIRAFQQTGQRIRRAEKPVVLCVHGQTLGGGCEFAMAAQSVVAAAETYIGLVELGVGLIPAGGGCLRMAQMAAARGLGDPKRMEQWLEDAFKTIGTARVATSAPMAKQLGYLPASTVVVLDTADRFTAARAEVARLHLQGWRPAPDDGVLVLGEAMDARFRVMADNLAAGSQISQYDAFLARRLGWILTGGGITAPTVVPESYVLDLERTVFIELLQQPKTLARIESILKHNKPLRN